MERDMRGYVVAIAGSGNFCDITLMKQVADEVLLRYPARLIITGDTFGGDYEAAVYAGSKGIPAEILTAAGDTKEALTARNVELIRRADVLLVFWDGSSPGTAQKMEMAQRKGIPVIVRRFDPHNQRMESNKCQIAFCRQQSAAGATPSYLLPELSNATAPPSHLPYGVR